jgi:hypothetical protein
MCLTNNKVHICCIENSTSKKHGIFNQSKSHFKERIGIQPKK